MPFFKKCDINYKLDCFPSIGSQRTRWHRFCNYGHGLAYPRSYGNPINRPFSPQKRPKISVGPLCPSMYGPLPRRPKHGSPLSRLMRKITIRCCRDQITAVLGTGVDYLQIVPTEQAQQEDSVSCGIFMLLNAERFLNRQPPARNVLPVR
jgi:hypothetical protein